MAEAIDLVDEDGDDVQFLSLVDAAEVKAVAALAGTAKRQKLSTSVAATAAHQSIVEEGSYMAALRGSRSSFWQQHQQELKLVRKVSSRSGGGKPLGGDSTSSISAGDACFKCGVAGHWARDCTAAREREVGGASARGCASVGGEDGEMPEKACPCGSGSCLVFTSNTAKNPGRKFYRCPLKAENGGCNFFEWCDSPSSTSISKSGSTLNRSSSLSVPDLPCPCGAGPCLVLVTKSGKNLGRQYYRCPKNDGSGSCGFFKWLIDQASSATQPSFASESYESNQTSSQLSADGISSSCFKCGQGGHWARDCPKQSYNTYSDTGGNRLATVGSTTCFKCGKAGHYARDCTARDVGATSGAFKASKTSRTPHAYN